MAKRETVSSMEDFSPFARWLIRRMQLRGTSLRRVSEATEIDYSYLFKVKQSHQPKYRQYLRPGFAYTQKIGEYLGDVKGAMGAAGWIDEETGDPRDNMPETITYANDEDLQILVESYNGPDGYEKTLVQSLAKTLREARSRGSIGQRAEISEDDLRLGHGEEAPREKSRNDIR